MLIPIRQTVAKVSYIELKLLIDQELEEIVPYFALYAHCRRKHKSKLKVLESHIIRKTQKLKSFLKNLEISFKRNLIKFITAYQFYLNTYYSIFKVKIVLHDFISDKLNENRILGITCNFFFNQMYKEHLEI